jgi:hypothetical protein
VRRKNEELLWTGHQRNQGLRRMATAGLLLGLKDIAQGRGWELKPYAAGYLADAPGRTPAVARNGSANIGGDVTYNFTPSLRGVASVNTDFAETEVDQRLVNLTRFPLFFPEQRPFFTEGAAIFDFGRPREAQLFYSRRIGLGANGNPVTIPLGVRMQGRAGSRQVGFLAARTSGEEKTTNAVLRVKQDFLGRGYIGAMGTFAGETGRPASTAGGLDFFLPYIVLGGQNFIVDNRTGAGGMIAAQLTVDSPGDGFRIERHPVTNPSPTTICR